MASTTKLTAHQRAKILARASDVVSKNHIKRVPSWPALVAEHKERIVRVEHPAEFEQAMLDLLENLGMSHTRFYHRSLNRFPAQRCINATYQPYESPEGPRWMFQDVHEGGPAALAGVEPGDLLIAIADREVRPLEIPLLAMGQTNTLTVEKKTGQVRRLTIPVGMPKRGKRPLTEPRITSWSPVADSVGYIKISMFPGIVGIDVARDTDRAVRELDCSRLIVDLRGNCGGGIGGLRLMSYLTPSQLPVGYSVTRRALARGYDKERLPHFDRIPSRKSALFGLALRFAFRDRSIAIFTEGLGPQKFHGRAVLLVNQHTASAAEMTTGFVKENHLATIVGTRTAGQVLGGKVFKVGYGYLLGIPVTNYLTWNGTVLEGNGVEPDESIEVTHDSLIEGRDIQLERAAAIAESM